MSLLSHSSRFLHSDNIWCGYRSLSSSFCPISCPFFVAWVASKYQSRSEAYSLTVSQQDTFLRREVVSTSSKPKAVGSKLFGRPQLFIQNIRNYPPFWRPFLHPKTEDATCRGDMDTIITDRHKIPVLIDARHNFMCPVEIMSGFILMHFDCSLLLHSRRPRIVCPRCFHVNITGIRIKEQLQQWRWRVFQTWKMSENCKT